MRSWVYGFGRLGRGNGELCFDLYADYREPELLALALAGLVGGIIRGNRIDPIIIFGGNSNDNAYSER